MIYTPSLVTTSHAPAHGTVFWPLVVGRIRNSSHISEHALGPAENN